MIEAAAIVFSSLGLIAILFQLALACGVPWGKFAMGGAFPGKYPPMMRLAAVGQAIFLALTAKIILTKAGLLASAWHELAGATVWLVVLLMIISIILNSISKSKWERRVWLPVTLLLLLTSIIVAVG